MTTSGGRRGEERTEQERASRRAYDVILLGAFRYPEGDASANRVLSLAKTLAATGRTPLVVNDSPGNPAHAPTPGVIAAHDGIDYVCLRQPRGGRVARLLARTTRPLRVLSIVRSGGQSLSSVAWATVASGLYTPGLHLCLHRLGGMRTVADVVERPDPSQFAAGRRDPYFLRHRWTSWASGRLADRVIVVSSTLQAHFSRRKGTLVMPPAVDATEYRPHREHASFDDRLHLLYVGSPGRKDLLGVLLEAVDSLEPLRRDRVRVTIAGASYEQLRDSPDVGADLLARTESFLEVLGHVSRHRVKELLAEADFSFLLRPAVQYANAGFPSKVPESLAAGCPVIFNPTSDLEDYLRDGHDSIICRTSDVAAVRHAVERALSLAPEDLRRASGNARTTAERTFHYEVWATPFDKLLSSER